MANKVNNSPNLPAPLFLTSFPSISDFATTLIQSLLVEIRAHALRLNGALVKDGTEAMTGPMVLKTYVKAALPVAATYTNGLIVVSDDVGGLTPAFSDGTNWRRVADRAVIA